MKKGLLFLAILSTLASVAAAITGVVGLIQVNSGGQYVLGATSGGFSGSGLTTLQPGNVFGLTSATGTPASWPLDFSTQGIVLTQGQIVLLPGNSAGSGGLPLGASGMIVVTESSTGSTGLYVCGGTTCVLAAQSTGTVWTSNLTNASPSPGQASIMLTGTPAAQQYYLVNNVSGSDTFWIALEKTRSHE